MWLDWFMLCLFCYTSYILTKSVLTMQLDGVTLRTAASVFFHFIFCWYCHVLVTDQCASSWIMTTIFRALASAIAFLCTQVLKCNVSDPSLLSSVVISVDFSALGPNLIEIVVALLPLLPAYPDLVGDMLQFMIVKNRYACDMLQLTTACLQMLYNTIFSVLLKFR